MRILLDESVPRRFGEYLAGVDVESVHDRGWAGLKNGELLRAAEQEYDLFLTADQNLQFQQRLASYAIRVIVLAARSNRLQDLLPLARRILERAATLAEGEVVVLRGEQAAPPAT